MSIEDEDLYRLERARDVMKSLGCLKSEKVSLVNNFVYSTGLDLNLKDTQGTSRATFPLG